MTQKSGELLPDFIVHVQTSRERKLPSSGLRDRFTKLLVWHHRMLEPSHIPTRLLWQPFRPRHKLLLLHKPWWLTVTDLKDSIFLIPHHEEDCKKIAFSIPTVNSSWPDKIHKWNFTHGRWPIVWPFANNICIVSSLLILTKIIPSYMFIWMI